MVSSIDIESNKEIDKRGRDINSEKNGDS